MAPSSSSPARCAAPATEPGRLTPADVQALAAAGHEIAGHTLNHVDLAQLAIDDPYELRRQVCNDRRALQALGLQPIGFAYPRSQDDGAHEVVAALRLPLRARRRRPGPAAAERPPRRDRPAITIHHLRASCGDLHYCIDEPELRALVT